MSTGRSTAIRDRFRHQAKARGDACHICGKTIDYTLGRDEDLAFVADHVIPIAKGGEDALTNLKAAHRRPAAATAPREHASSPPSCDAAAA